MDRLEAMLTIERGYGRGKERCRFCSHVVPSAACEAPLCPKLNEMQMEAPAPDVARDAERIREELILLDGDRE